MPDNWQWQPICDDEQWEIIDNRESRMKDNGNCQTIADDRQWQMTVKDESFALLL